MGYLTKAALIAAVLAAAVTFPPQIVSAERFEYKEYTVKKGDTLWSITKRELVDAFQWPLVWKENQRINNPDLIYPGQIILIPIRMIADNEPARPAEQIAAAGPEMPLAEQKIETASIEPQSPAIPEVPGASAPPAPPPPPKQVMKHTKKDLDKRAFEPLVPRQVLIQGGYITKYLPNAGEIQGSPTGRFAYGNSDVIYIKTKEPVAKGQKFYVVRPLREVEHPVTGDELGWVVKVVGTVEAIEDGTDEVKTLVLESFDDIANGDILDYYNEMLPPYVTDNPRKPDISGYVIVAAYLRLVSANYDVAFIDKGINDGVQNGDVFVTLMENTTDAVNGVMQVINVRNTTSLVVILKSRREIYPGDTFQKHFEDAEQLSSEAKQ